MSTTHIRRTSVRRRIVALFMVCGLLPVAAAVLVSYNRVADELVGQRVALLRGAAATQANVLVDRLDAAERIALEAAMHAEPAAIGGEQAVRRMFLAAVSLGPGQPRVLFGASTRIPTFDAAHLERPPLAGVGRLVADSNGPSVWILAPRDPTGKLGAGVAFQVDPAYLWEPSDQLPELTELCVLNIDGRALGCDRPPPESELVGFLNARNVSRQTIFSWNLGGVQYISGVRELFLGGRFGAPAWFVIASQREDHALAPVRELTAVIIPVVLLGLLVTALLGLVHVRRTLRPLAELTQAAERIAMRDFEVRVPALRDDEFGVLARTFNDTTSRLGRQFSALRAQAEIDAAILSSPDLARVAEIVLRRIAGVVQADRYALLLDDPTRTRTCVLYSIDENDALAGHDVEVSGVSLRRFKSAMGGVRLTRTSIGSDEVLSAIPGESFFVLAFDPEQVFGGALVLAFDSEYVLDDESGSLIAMFADRVSVALTTARRERELHRRAYYDSLTNLPNRLLGLEELARGVAAATRQERTLAVLFVDLDGFADINDSLGHSAGDAVLVEAARRLLAGVRSSDVVSRLGGDEFAVVLPEVRTAADAAVAARHVVDAMSRPIALADGIVRIGASVGVAVFPGDGNTAEELLRNADLAMYRAKESDQNKVVFYEASMNDELVQRLELDRELRIAIEQRQLRLFYQPQLDLRTGRIIGCEALIRWIHPVRGTVPPLRFVPYAETSGMIVAIGQWALREACRQWLAWRASGLLTIQHVSVNISSREFQLDSLVDSVRDLLREMNMPEGTLHLEITESAVLGEHPSVKANLNGFVSLGVPLELDDFGTGYSSLAHLQRLPVSVVKLDRAFIRSVHESSKSLAVVRAAIDMAHALDKIVVAEGVENPEQRALLAQIGCDTMQGYVLSAPLPPEEFEALAQRHLAASAGSAG